MDGVEQIVDGFKADRARLLVKEAAITIAVGFCEGFESDREICESPIEVLLLAGLYTRAVGGIVELTFMGRRVPDKEVKFQGGALVYQQAEVGKYRADFLIADCSWPAEEKGTQWIVVECDGHDFHERTKEQAKRDKQRDRFFQSEGYKVLRFTGSEIWADPEECASEITEQLGGNARWNRSAA